MVQGEVYRYIYLKFEMAFHDSQMTMIYDRSSLILEKYFSDHSDHYHGGLNSQLI